MYGKIFKQIYKGTLAMVGPWEALVTFQQMIILADKDGVVDMTPDALSRETTIPLKIITKGIEALESPDPESRTPDYEGRRIIRLSENRTWGWRLVNYEHYRKLRSEEERREYHRNYWHKRKQKPGEIEKINARRVTNNAITQGRLTQGPCEVCGVDYGIEAHHDDYKKPLEVRWLCKKHHVELHNNTKDTTRPQHASTNTTNSRGISKGKGKERGASRIPPDDFEVSAKQKSWALEEGFSEAEIKAETAKFKDHEYPRPLKDWNRAWRNWMRKAQQWKTPAPATAMTEAERLGLVQGENETDERFQRRLSDALVQERYG